MIQVGEEPKIFYINKNDNIKEFIFGLLLTSDSKMIYKIKYFIF